MELLECLEKIKDSLTPDGTIIEHTKEYKFIKKYLLNKESIKKLNRPYHYLVVYTSYVRKKEVICNSIIDCTKPISVNDIDEIKNSMKLNDEYTEDIIILNIINLS